MARQKTAKTKEPELPEGVEYVTVRIPVYTGEVKTDRPLQIEQVNFKMLSEEQRIGVNRVFQAIARLVERDGNVPHAERRFERWMNSRSEAARHVFVLIHKACQEQLS